jgi:hypothetical protein
MELKHWFFFQWETYHLTVDTLKISVFFQHVKYVSIFHDISCFFYGGATTKRQVHTQVVIHEVIKLLATCRLSPVTALEAVWPGNHRKMMI